MDGPGVAQGGQAARKGSDESFRRLHRVGGEHVEGAAKRRGERVGGAESSKATAMISNTGSLPI